MKFLLTGLIFFLSFNVFAFEKDAANKLLSFARETQLAMKSASGCSKMFLEQGLKAENSGYCILFFNRYHKEWSAQHWKDFDSEYDRVENLRLGGNLDNKDTNIFLNVSDEYPGLIRKFNSVVNNAHRTIELIKKHSK